MQNPPRQIRFHHPSDRRGPRAKIAARQRAVVAVQSRKATRHLDEDLEIIRIQNHQTRPAMRGDAGHSDFQGARQDPRSRQLRRQHRQGSLAARVGQQDETGLCHPLQKSGVPRVVPIDVLAIGQALQNHRPTRQAPLELLVRIGPRRMYRHGRQKLRMPAGQAQYVVIGDVERAGVGDLLAGVTIGFVLRQNHRGIERRFADKFQHLRRIEPIEIAGQGRFREPDTTNHIRGTVFRDTPRVIPASGAAGAVAHNMEMTVDPHGPMRRLAGYVTASTAISRQRFRSVLPVPSIGI